MSSQDKGICEQTAVLIVALCSAECSLSNICLCDTLGLPRAVGRPSAACPRPSDAHRWDIPLSAGLRPGHPLGSRPLSCPLLGFLPPSLPVPWKVHMHSFRLFAASTSTHMCVGVCGDRGTPVSISPPALSSGPSCPPPHLSPVLIYRVGALSCFIWSLRHLWALATCSSGLWTFWMLMWALLGSWCWGHCQPIFPLPQIYMYLVWEVPIPSHLLSFPSSPGGVLHSLVGDFMSY